MSILSIFKLIYIHIILKASRRAVNVCPKKKNLKKRITYV